MKIINFFIIFFISIVFLHAQTVDDVIDKYLEAIGGVEKISAIKSIKITGNQDDGDLNNSFTIFIKKPLLFKMETEVDEVSVIEACNENTAWTINPFEGKTKARKLNVDELADLHERIEIIDPPFLNYKDKGNKVVLSGKENMDGKEVYKILLTRIDGAKDYYCFDGKTHLLCKKITKKTVSGKEEITERIYDDYRKTDGYFFPYFMVLKVSGEKKVVAATTDDDDESAEEEEVNIAKTFVSNIELNISLEDSIFSMPSE